MPYRAPIGPVFGPSLPCWLLVGFRGGSRYVDGVCWGVGGVLGCKGGSRYFEGFWGFPYLKMKKVSWFVGFLASWFLMFYRFSDIKDVSRIHLRKIPCVLKMLGKTNCFGPEQNSKSFKSIQWCFKQTCITIPPRIIRRI